MTSFYDIDANATAQLLAMATDVSLVMNHEGVIQDFSFGASDLPIPDRKSWVGQRWIDIVTSECRAKIQELLDDANNDRAPRWRQVNYRAGGGPDVPVLFSAISMDNDGRIIAFGRDVRPLEQLQRRLVDAQQSMERDYVRLRQAETRYRILFQESTEAVLVLDAYSRIIVDANPAASRLLKEPAEHLVGSVFPQGFDAEDRAAVIGLLESVKGMGNSDSIKTASPFDGGGDLTISASALLHDDRPLFVVRLSSGRAANNEEGHLSELLNKLPDGVIVTDTAGKVIIVNQTFSEMVQLQDRKKAIGESVDRWLGLSGVDIPVLIATLKERGMVRLFRTTVRDEYGSVSDVEVCAVSVPSSSKPYFALCIRNIEQRLSVTVQSDANVPKSMAQVTELVGRVPLKKLVGEAADLVERMCIEAALNLTGDNRASAAEILGLSRQSLYVKLRRHGLSERKPPGDDEPSS